MWLSGRARSPFATKLGDVLAEFDIPDKQRGEYFEARPMHNAEAFLDEKKQALIDAGESITLISLYRVNEVEMKSGRITAVVAESIASSKRIRVAGRYFADCTGDGCVGYAAGADYELSANEHMGRSNQWSVKNVGKPTTFPRCPWAGR